MHNTCLLECCELWDTARSTDFKMANGVKQGGVTSAILSMIP